MRKYTPVEDAFDTVLLKTETAYKRMPIDAKAGIGFKLREYLEQFPEYGDVQSNGRRHKSNLLPSTQLSFESQQGYELMTRAEALLARKTVRGEDISEIKSALITWLTNPETHPHWSHDSMEPRQIEGKAPKEDTPDRIYRHDNKSHKSGEALTGTDITHLVNTFTDLLRDTLQKDEEFRKIAGIGASAGM